jgi:myo-inositol catabolism protein IolC
MAADDLYFLAFDHRGAFARSVLDVAEPTAEDDVRMRRCKALLFDAAAAAADRVAQRRGRVGILIDELYGADPAAAACDLNLVLAMPVEEPDLDVFDFAYGETFREHVERFDPDYAKVLVRYNVEGDAVGNRIQQERLRTLSDWLAERGRRLLFELLVGPTPKQLRRAGGEQLRFELEQRPALIVRAMRELQEAGVRVDLWKLEGIDALEDAERIAAQAREYAGTGAEEVRCVVLGAGADQERVDRWLHVAAASEGFAGFAIGRSIWRDPLREHLAGTLSREAAIERVIERYLRFIDVYEAPANGT